MEGSMEPPLVFEDDGVEDELDNYMCELSTANTSNDIRPESAMSELSRLDQVLLTSEMFISIL